MLYHRQIQTPYPVPTHLRAWITIPPQEKVAGLPPKWFQKVTGLWWPTGLDSCSRVRHSAPGTYAESPLPVRARQVPRLVKLSAPGP